MVVFSLFLLLLLPFLLLRKICFHVDATVGGSDTAGRISGGRFRVRADRKGRGSIFLAFPRRFRRRAEPRASEEQQQPVVEASRSRLLLEASGLGRVPSLRAASGGSRRRRSRTRKVSASGFLSTSPPLPILPSCGFSFFFSLPPRCSRLDCSPFGLSSGELAVRT